MSLFHLYEREMSKPKDPRQKIYRRRWRLKNRKRTNEYLRKWRAKNKQRMAEHGRKWRQNNKGKIKSYRQKWLKANGRNYRLLYKYGLTQEKYERLLSSQNFKCAACESDLRNLDKLRVHVDHCHKTNAVRSILCRNCNLSLGLMKDDPVKLQKLANYAARFK